MGGEGDNGPVPGKHHVVDREHLDGALGSPDEYAEDHGQGSVNVGFVMHWRYHPQLGLVSHAMNCRKRRAMGNDRTGLVMSVVKVVDGADRPHEL